MNPEIHLGDCYDFLREFQDQEFDVAIVDPPYFADAARASFHGGKKCRTTGVRRNQNPKPQNWEIPTAEYFEQLQRVSKHQIVWGFNYFTEAAAAANFNPEGRIIWDKVNTKATFSDCEIAATTTNHSVRKITFMWNGMLQGSTRDGSIQEGDKRKNERRIHPTQKPVQLYRMILERFCEPGWSVLDTHLGSGSSAIACHERGHPFIGIEKDPRYFEATRERIEAATAQPTLI